MASGSWAAGRVGGSEVVEDLVVRDVAFTGGQSDAAGSIPSDFTRRFARPSRLRQTRCAGAHRRGPCEVALAARRRLTADMFAAGPDAPSNTAAGLARRSPGATASAPSNTAAGLTPHARPEPARRRATPPPAVQQPAREQQPAVQQPAREQQPAVQQPAREQQPACRATPPPPVQQPARPDAHANLETIVTGPSAPYVNAFPVPPSQR